GGVVTTMALYALMTIVEANDFKQSSVALISAGADDLLLSLITLAVVLTRAIFVPATARRTFWISLCAAGIGPFAAVRIGYVSIPRDMLAENPWLPYSQSIYVAMWATLTVVVATTAARVIHGLTQRVRDANEI